MLKVEGSEAERDPVAAMPCGDDAAATHWAKTGRRKCRHTHTRGVRRVGAWFTSGLVTELVAKDCPLRASDQRPLHILAQTHLRQFWFAHKAAYPISVRQNAEVITSILANDPGHFAGGGRRQQAG